MRWGEFYLIIVTKQECNDIYPRAGKAVGMDFGLKHFLNLDDSSVIDSPQWYKASLKELQVAHRAVSRCQKGSQNRRRAIRHLERVYQRISNRRRDWFFKLANQLVGEYAIICIEDLNLDGMKRLWGRKVSDLAFYRVCIHPGMGGQQRWVHCRENRPVGAIQQGLSCVWNSQPESHTEAAALDM